MFGEMDKHCIELLFAPVLAEDCSMGCVKSVRLTVLGDMFVSPTVNKKSWVTMGQRAKGRFLDRELGVQYWVTPQYSRDAACFVI